MSAERERLASDRYEMRAIPTRSVGAKKTKAPRELFFSKAEKIKLVNLIEPYTIIHHGTKSSAKALKCWIKIAEKHGRSVWECQQCWKRIKYYYVRCRQMGRQMTHYLEDHLKFLAKYQLCTQVRNESSIKKNVGNDTAPPSDRINEKVEVDNPLSDSTKEQFLETGVGQQSTGCADTFLNGSGSETIMKITRVETEQSFVGEMDRSMTSNSQENHVDMFFKCIAAQVKSFPKHFINEAKLKIMQTIVELDNKCALNVSYYKNEL